MRSPRTLRRLFLVGMLACALVPFASRPAWACSCAAGSPRDWARNADAVFTGTVARVTNDAPDRVVNFDVDTVYAGERIPSIDVRTAADGSACGVRFVLNRRYTVFAFRRGGALRTSSCTGPLGGGVDPAVLGLGPGVTGLHRPLSPWLFVFSIAAGAIVVWALVVVARRRRRGGEP